MPRECYSYAEHYRKVVLSQCKEIVRAQYAAAGLKLTEDRADDLARTHPLYLDYLIINGLTGDIVGTYHDQADAERWAVKYQRILGRRPPVAAVRIQEIGRAGEECEE